MKYWRAQGLKGRFSWSEMWIFCEVDPVCKTLMKHEFKVHSSISDKERGWTLPWFKTEASPLHLYYLPLLVQLLHPLLPRSWSLALSWHSRARGEKIRDRCGILKRAHIHKQITKVIHASQRIYKIFFFLEIAVYYLLGLSSVVYLCLSGFDGQLLIRCYSLYNQFRSVIWSYFTYSTKWDLNLIYNLQIHQNMHTNEYIILYIKCWPVLMVPTALTFLYF